MIGLLLPLALGQAKPVRDPKLHRTWVSIAAPYPELRQTLRLDPGGKFTLTSQGPYASDNMTVQGTYALGRLAPDLKKMAPKGSFIYFTVSLDALQKTGASPETIAKLKKEKRTKAVLMRLVYNPAVPDLTDGLSTVFAPVGMEEEVAKRYPRSPVGKGS